MSMLDTEPASDQEPKRREAEDMLQDFKDSQFRRDFNEQIEFFRANKIHVFKEAYWNVIPKDCRAKTAEEYLKSIEVPVPEIVKEDDLVNGYYLSYPKSLAYDDEVEHFKAVTWPEFIKNDSPEIVAKRQKVLQDVNMAAVAHKLTEEQIDAIEQILGEMHQQKAK